MRVVPFGMEDITRLAVAAAVPLLPFGLTMFSLDGLAMEIVKMLF